MGIEDFRIVERRPFMGGTWLQNRYPGAAVDVQSPLYSITREPYNWSQMFAKRDELEAYTNHVIDKHRLREKTDLNTNVERLTWDEASQRWLVKTSGERNYSAQFIISASGPLSTPSIPPFEGKELFEGASFHTNDWDPEYDYRGKRVAVIGSGASAAQVIPAIAPDVAQLHVFQRSPHWVLPRADRVFTRFERSILRHPAPARILREALYWSLESRVIAFKYAPWILKTLGNKEALAHLRKQVSDAELRRKLTPDYTIGCKRVILSNTLYPALCRENVTLHDRHDSIASIDPSGINTAQGNHLDLDLIVYATGYDATDGTLSFEVIGRDGQTLSNRWREYPRAYLGTAVPGFPNHFLTMGPNTGIGHTSALFIIESQMLYMMRCIRETLDRNVASIEVAPSAEQRYTAHIHSEMVGTVWESGGCQSWYQNKSGKIIAIFPGFSFMYRLMARRFKSEDHRFAGAS